MIDENKLNEIFEEMKRQIVMHVGGEHLVHINSVLQWGFDAVKSLDSSDRVVELKSMCLSVGATVDDDIVRDVVSNFSGDDLEFNKELPNLVERCVKRQDLRNAFD